MFGRYVRTSLVMPVARKDGVWITGVVPAQIFRNIAPKVCSKRLHIALFRTRRFRDRVAYGLNCLFSGSRCPHGYLIPIMGMEKYIDWSVVKPEEAEPITGTILRTTGRRRRTLGSECHLYEIWRDLINSGLSRWRMAVEMYGCCRGNREEFRE